MFCAAAFGVQCVGRWQVPCAGSSAQHRQTGPVFMGLSVCRGDGHNEEGVVVSLTKQIVVNRERRVHEGSRV